MIDTDKYEGHGKGHRGNICIRLGVEVDYIMSPYEGCVAKIDNGDKSSVENEDALFPDKHFWLDILRLRGATNERQ